MAGDVPTAHPDGVGGVAAAHAMPRRAAGASPGVLLAILSMCVLGYTLANMLVVPALPVLQHDLHTTTAWAAWLFTGFALVSVVVTPILGKLGDQYGRRRVLSATMAVFVVALLASALVSSIGALIVCRAAQGVAGGILPLSYALIRDHFPRERIVTAFGVVAALSATGMGLGFVLSGVLVDVAGWRYLFVVSAGWVAVSLVLVRLLVPESPVRTRSRADVPGAVLLAGSLVCLMLALTQGSAWGWASVRIDGLFAASAVVLASWIVLELRTREPMVDVRMLARRVVLLANAVTAVIGFVSTGFFIMIPQFVQAPALYPERVARLVDYGFGATALATGLYMLPGALVGIVGSWVGGVLGRRRGARWPLVLGLMLGVLAFASLATWHAHPWQLVGALIVLGFGTPMTFAATTTLIAEAVQLGETGVAMGMNIVFRTVGGVVGGQLCAAILAGSTIAGTVAPTSSAFAAAFWLTAAIGAAGALTALTVTPRAGRHRAAPA